MSVTARRLVVVAGRSAKFWEAEVDDATLTLRWGPLGGATQEKAKTFASASAAERERDKLTAKKIAEGYREEGDAPATERPRIAWDAKTRALVHPRRGANVSAPKTDVAKAWKTVTAAFDKKARAAVTSGRKEATKEDRALMDEVVASFAKKAPPEHGDPVIEGVRAALLDVEGHNGNTSPALLKAHDALVALWCAKYGLAFAVQAMLETFRTVRVDYGPVVYAMRKPESLGTFGNVNHYREWTDPVDVTPWHVLRAALAAADEKSYAAARAVAEPVHDQGADVLFRCMLSFVFPDEEAWARATLAKTSYLVQGTAPAIYHCGHVLVSCFRDSATIRQIIEQGAFHAELVYDILDVLGPGAFSLLRERYGNGRFRDKRVQKSLFGAITLIESEPAAKWIRKYERDPVVGALARAYFERAPDLRSA